MEASRPLGECPLSADKFEQLKHLMLTQRRLQQTADRPRPSPDQIISMKGHASLIRTFVAELTPGEAKWVRRWRKQQRVSSVSREGKSKAVGDVIEAPASRVSSSPIAEAATVVALMAPALKRALSSDGTNMFSELMRVSPVSRQLKSLKVLSLSPSPSPSPPPSRRALKKRASYYIGPGASTNPDIERAVSHGRDVGYEAGHVGSVSSGTVPPRPPLSRSLSHHGRRMLLAGVGGLHKGGFDHRTRRLGVGGANHFAIPRSKLRRSVTM